MFKTIKKILKYPRLTLKYPDVPMDSELFIGKPVVKHDKCTKCGVCMESCPTGAIGINDEGLVGINMDDCIFCVRCEDVCAVRAIEMSTEFELEAGNRSELRHFDRFQTEQDQIESLVDKISKKSMKKLGRSLQIREVDSGSCNGCDYEINALNNPFNDIERFGMHFVPSPRHADMLLVTGCCTRNMETALLKVYEATPSPKLVVAVGACACSGGIFKDSYATKNGIDSVIPVDMYIPGCPPRPQAVLHGILRAIDRI